MEITDWRTLTVGQHVQLGCGCAGYIAEVRTTSSDENNIGFLIKYTREKCCNGNVSRWGYRNSYSNGYGPYGNFYNHGSADDYYPIVETPAPAWWSKFEDGPCRKLYKLKMEREKKILLELNRNRSGGDAIYTYKRGKNG